jgi:hypothetical protein
MEDLVNRFFGRKVDVLDDIRPVDERRVYKGGCGGEGWKMRG